MCGSDRAREVRLRAIRFASYTALRCRAATVQRALEPSVGRRVPRRLDQWLDCSREKSCWWVEPHKQKSNTSKGTWGKGGATANNWPQLQRGMDPSFAPPLPGAAVPLRPRSASGNQQNVAWWKTQLEMEHSRQQQQPPRARPVSIHSGANGRPDAWSSEDENAFHDESETVYYATEVAALRDELRAARRKLDAGQRRERALRHALQKAKVPS